jgi:hypothetical protein
VSLIAVAAIVKDCRIPGSDFRFEGVRARAFNRKGRKELPQSAQRNSNLSHYPATGGNNSILKAGAGLPALN